MEIRPFELSDEAAVVELWRICGLVRPWNDPHQDVHRKLRVQRELFLVGEHDGTVVAAVMAGYDGHRGSVNYLAVHPDFRARGFGRSLVRAIEQALAAVGCPKINLMVRQENGAVLEFYRRLGYVQDPVVVLSTRLKQDAPPTAE